MFVALVDSQLSDVICIFVWRYILQKSHELHKALVRVPAAVTGAVSWRSENIKYSKNEVFIDVIEKVNMLVCLSLSLSHSYLFIPNLLL